MATEKVSFFNLDHLKRKVFSLSTDPMIRLFGLNRAGKLACHFLEKIEPIYHIERNQKEFRFYCPNALTRWRAATLFEKEPETIEWIDSFGPKSVLFDIGANVGLYSIYAAKMGHQVISFEPESQNYALLNHNIHLNELSYQIKSLNIAISQETRLDYLYLPRFKPGGALNNWGSANDSDGNEFAPSYRQAVFGYSLDEFLKQNPDPFPNHIKIDVDGLEVEILKGAEKTLGDPRLRSLSIEVNEAMEGQKEGIETALEAQGLKFSSKGRGHLFEGTAHERSFNYIFRRGPS